MRLRLAGPARPDDDDQLPQVRGPAGDELPSWDKDNKYTMAWQSGFTAVGYNCSVVKDPATTIDILFDKKYAGKVGMLADPHGARQPRAAGARVDPANSTESDWAKAAKKLQQQKSDGIVRAYYDQELHRPSQERRHHRHPGLVGRHLPGRPEQQVLRNLRLLVPEQGAMFWTDNLCIPHERQEPQGCHGADGLLLLAGRAGRAGVLQRLRVPGARLQAGAAGPVRLGQDGAARRPERRGRPAGIR